MSKEENGLWIVFEVALAYDIEVHHLNDVAAVDVYTRVLPRLAGCIAIGQNVLNIGIIRSNNYQDENKNG